MMRILALGVVFLSFSAAWADPCKSGLAPNQRPGPYSALVCVGPQRGQQHCFICDAADRPIVIVFARNLTDPLGKLAGKLEVAVRDQKAAELRSWITFLADDQTGMDPKIVAWARKHAVSNVSCAVFEDTAGPPAYLLAKEADVTVLLAVKQKVVANFAFRAGELNDAKIGEIAQAMGRLVPAAPAK